MMCISGKAKIAAVKINNFKKPSKKTKVYNWIIDSKKPDVVYIPQAMQMEQNL